MQNCGSLESLAAYSFKRTRMLLVDSATRLLSQALLSQRSQPAGEPQARWTVEIAAT